jgi:hypothetical protein
VSATPPLHLLAIYYGRCAEASHHKTSPDNMNSAQLHRKTRLQHNLTSVVSRAPAAAVQNWHRRPLLSHCCCRVSRSVTPLSMPGTGSPGATPSELAVKTTHTLAKRTISVSDQGQSGAHISSNSATSKSPAPPRHRCRIKWCSRKERTSALAE